jgi:hypothetical protein
VNTPTRSTGDVNDEASTGEASASESGENGEVSSYFHATVTSALCVAFRFSETCIKIIPVCLVFQEIFQGERLIKAPGFSDKFRYWVDHEELLGFY